ncbi:hypothetical protein BJ912DRAFT_997387 [Pholiota molesta]|nr:hypothetical protein BJ912DRAFT_997387 [Pholiota molesta]
MGILTRYRDTLLVLFPMFWFWNIRLPPKERRLILLAFCGNVLTLLSAIIYLILIKLGMSKDNVTQYLFHVGMGHINAGIALFVCNFTVVTTALYRLVRRRRPSTSVPMTITTTTRETTQETSLPIETTYPLTHTMESSSGKSQTTSLILTEISSFSPVHDSYTSNSVDSKISASTT